MPKCITMYKVLAKKLQILLGLHFELVTLQGQFTITIWQDN
jgi:hypothetical protein